MKKEKRIENNKIWNGSSSRGGIMGIWGGRENRQSTPKRHFELTRFFRGSRGGKGGWEGKDEGEEGPVGLLLAFGRQGLMDDRRMIIGVRIKYSGSDTMAMRG